MGSEFYSRRQYSSNRENNGRVCFIIAKIAVHTHIWLSNVLKCSFNIYQDMAKVKPLIVIRRVVHMSLFYIESRLK